MKFSKIKRAVKHYLSMKAARRKVGLHGKSKFLRQLKRSLKPSVVASPYSTSATTEGYRHSASTLSQLTGGV